MTIEDLERGMKLLFDQQVHFSDQMMKSEQRQDRTDQQIAELTADQRVTMKAITAVVAMVGELTDAQKHTDAGIRELTESQKNTDAIVAALGRRIDAFIAALGNGHKNPL